VHYPNKKHTADNEPPQGYVCYRCGEKGHWIKECPTNDDPNYENKPRIKRTTGIPRSFLKTVDKQTALSGDGSEDSKPPSGVMVNAEGQFVIAEPDRQENIHRPNEDALL
jgi:protein MPE1